MKMKFVEFRDAIYNHFNQMLQDCGIDRLFVTGVDLDQLYDQYNDFFPKERNPLFRKQREHECSACRHFIKMAGGVVAIKPDYSIESIWDIKIPDEAYQEVADKLSKIVKRFAITGAFVPYSKVVGCKCNLETEPESPIIRQWEHFYVEVPKSMVSREPNIDQAKFRGKAEVFERSLDMISMDAIDTVLDLINQNNLYRGAEKKSLIEKFKVLKEKYATVEDGKKKHFIWRESAICPDSVSHIKNDVIGTLMVDITSGMDLAEAVRLYESKTAPENYRRSKPVYSQRMLDDAKKQIEELGYMSALQRRFATIDDLTVNEMMFVNRNATSTTVVAAGPEALFNSMEKSIAVDPRKFRSAPTIPIKQFIQEVLPMASSVELLFEQPLTKHMVSLIGPVDPTAKSLFRWGNPFSWAYTGNMTDSVLKKNVKNAGGDVTGDLRFSIQWNDIPDQWDQNDLDAHCIYNEGRAHIYFSHKHDMFSGGALDIDIFHPTQGVPAVENITFPSRERMAKGEYLFLVHCYSGCGGRSGFRAEIEFDGQIFEFDYTDPLKHGEQIKVATVTLKEDGTFTINPMLKSTMGGGREVWGIHTNQFVPVTAIMNSPNYWAPDSESEDEKNHGAHHLFFMLKDCKNPEEPNPFFNEFLNSDFANFRRVMEALGSKAHVATVDDQLSGVGFAYTQHATVILKINGDKVYNVKF